MWVWNLTTSAPAFAIASTYECAMPSEPSCAWATSAITRTCSASGGASSSAMPSRELPRPVGDHDVRPRARDRGERLLHRSVAVEPAALGRRHDRRVLAGDVIGGH